MKEEVQELIDCHAESDYLDFKEEFYSKENKEELVKDLIAFANSHSIRDKYILIGAKEKNNLFNGFSDFNPDTIDDSMIQQIVNSNIKEDLILSTELLDFDGNFIYAIKIPYSNNENRPFMVKRQLKNLKENQMFIRKGSSTVFPTKHDLQLMINPEKCSKLTVKSFSKNIEEKIVLKKINDEIKKYKELVYKKLYDKSVSVTNLKSNKFSFSENNMFLKDEKIELEEKTKKHIIDWFAKIGLKYNDDIFVFDNIRWKLNFNGIINGSSYILYGDDNEKQRYRSIMELEDLIIEYLVINNYSEKLPTIYSANLLLKNDGTYMDEDVELKLIIKENDYFDYKEMLLDDYDVSYLGNLFENIKKEFKCPDVSYIDNYDYFYIPPTNISSVKYPMLLGRDYKASYLDKVEDMTIDFENELENMYNFEKYHEENNVVLKFYFKKIMHNSGIFLQSKLLFLNRKIKINYEIKSKNNKNIIYGTINT